MLYGRKAISTLRANAGAGKAWRDNTTGDVPVSPWEKRERGGLYYTRSRRVNGRVVREYVGGGALGELAALTDTQERQRREEEAAAWREERERLEELAGLVDEFCEAVETVARATLLAAGFRQHKRGEWRRRRDRGTNTKK
jgi:hypothetical protein